MRIIRLLAIPIAIAIGLLGGAQCMAMAATPASTVPTSATPPVTVHSVIIPRSEAVIPETDSGCTGNVEWDMDTCFKIDGGWNYVQDMITDSCVLAAAIVALAVHQEISYGAGTAIANSLQYHLSRSECLETTFTFDKDVPTGDYHATTWVYDGGYFNAGEVTLPVS